MKYIVVGNQAGDAARVALSLGCTVWRLGETVWVVDDRDGLYDLAPKPNADCVAEPLAMQDAVDDRMPFDPVGESFYYHGVVMGHLGTVRQVIDGRMYAHTSGLKIVSEVFFWDDANKRWFVMYTDNPSVTN